MPICGYDELQQAPYDADGNESFEICHCCGFEFGFDDIHDGHTFESYRDKWMIAGATWFYQQSKPEVWDLKQQLKKIERIQPMYSSFWKRRSTLKWIKAGKILASNSTGKVPCPECGNHFLMVQDVLIKYANKIERIISCPSCFAKNIILMPSTVEPLRAGRIVELTICSIMRSKDVNVCFKMDFQTIWEMM